MTGYVVRRVLWGVVLLILVSALTFVLFRILPTAEPARLRAGRGASPATIVALRRDLGLNKPLIAQFWLYMKNLFLHFELGYSYHSQRIRAQPDLRTAARRRSHSRSGRPSCGSRSACRSASSQRCDGARAWTARAWASRWCWSPLPNTGWG